MLASIYINPASFVERVVYEAYHYSNNYVAMFGQCVVVCAASLCAWVLYYFYQQVRITKDLEDLFFMELVRTSALWGILVLAVVQCVYPWDTATAFLIAILFVGLYSDVVVLPEQFAGLYLLCWIDVVFDVRCMYTIVAMCALYGEWRHSHHTTTQLPLV